MMPIFFNVFLAFNGSKGGINILRSKEFIGHSAGFNNSVDGVVLSKLFIYFPVIARSLFDDI